MVNGLELFGLGASWGGYESLIMPNHPERYRTATTWDASFPSLRIHVGLEDPDDLIADLEAGFARLNRQRGITGRGERGRREPWVLVRHAKAIQRSSA